MNLLLFSQDLTLQRRRETGQRINEQINIDTLLEIFLKCPQNRCSKHKKRVSCNGWVYFFRSCQSCTFARTSAKGSHCLCRRCYSFWHGSLRKLDTGARAHPKKFRATHQRWHRWSSFHQKHFGRDLHRRKRIRLAAGWQYCHPWYRVPRQRLSLVESETKRCWDAHGEIRWRANSFRWPGKARGW